MLKKDDTTQQLVYYQAGIGTYESNPTLGTPFISKFSNILDQMLAWNAATHVMEGYQFLMENCAFYSRRYRVIFKLTTLCL